MHFILFLHFNYNSHSFDPFSYPSIHYLEAQSKQAQSNRNVPLCRLEYVRIYDMPRCAEDMKFMKILLLWATALKELEIKKCHHDDISGLPDGPKMLKELASFERRSKKAKITYKGLPIEDY